MSWCLSGERRTSRRIPVAYRRIRLQPNNDRAAMISNDQFFDRMKMQKMKTYTGSIVVGVATSAMVLFGAGTAAAVVPLVATPGTNSLTFTFQNNDVDSTTCSAHADGPVYFDTITLRVPPHASATVTYTDVPAGFYHVGWGCRAFSQGELSVTVGGAPVTGAKPHQGPAHPAPANPAPANPAPANPAPAQPNPSAPAPQRPPSGSFGFL